MRRSRCLQCTPVAGSGLPLPHAPLAGSVWRPSRIDRATSGPGDGGSRAVRKAPAGRRLVARAQPGVPVTGCCAPIGAARPCSWRTGRRRPGSPSTPATTPPHSTPTWHSRSTGPASTCRRPCRPTAESPPPGSTAAASTGSPPRIYPDVPVGRRPRIPLGVGVLPRYTRTHAYGEIGGASAPRATRFAAATETRKVMSVGDSQSERVSLTIRLAALDRTLTNLLDDLAGRREIGEVSGDTVE